MRSWGVPDPLKICKRVKVCFDPIKCHTFHSKLSPDNSTSFTSRRMKNLCQKIEYKTNFSRRLKQLMAWPDWPRQIYAIAIVAGGRRAGWRLTTSCSYAWMSQILRRQSFWLRPFQSPVLRVWWRCTSSATPDSRFPNARWLFRRTILRWPLRRSW